MRKFIILILLLVGSFSAWAQNGVLGIEFGTSKEEAKSILQKRFGEYHVRDSGEKLELRNVKFAGITFMYIDLIFDYINGNYAFNSAFLQTPFETTHEDDARASLDMVVTQMKRKYQVTSYGENSSGFCDYMFNTPQRFAGLINAYKAQGKDGIERIYLTISYTSYIKDAGLDDL